MTVSFNYIKLYFLNDQNRQMVCFSEKAFRDLNGFDIILRQNASDPGVTKRDNKILENNMCEIKVSNTLAKSIEIRRPGILTICEIRVVEGGKDRKIITN